MALARGRSRLARPAPRRRRRGLAPSRSRPTSACPSASASESPSRRASVGATSVCRITGMRIPRRMPRPHAAKPGVERRAGRNVAADSARCRGAQQLARLSRPRRCSRARASSPNHASGSPPARSISSAESTRKHPGLAGLALEHLARAQRRALALRVDEGGAAVRARDRLPATRCAPPCATSSRAAASATLGAIAVWTALEAEVADHEDRGDLELARVAQAVEPALELAVCAGEGLQSLRGESGPYAGRAPRGLREAQQQQLRAARRGDQLAGDADERGVALGARLRGRRLCRRRASPRASAEPTARRPRAAGRASC